VQIIVSHFISFDILKNYKPLKLTVSISGSWISLLLVLAVANNAAGKITPSYPTTITTTTSKNKTLANTNSYDNSAAVRYYDSLQLGSYGLSKQAWLYAYKGYTKLLKKGTISNPDVITVCDFSLSSRQKRLFIIDLKEGEMVLNTYVAHGRKSGAEYARKFSNKASSHESSLGFYVTRTTYIGEHGLALRIDGLDRGFNDNASRRHIVIHGSEYVGDEFIQENSFMGRSFGCPAVPAEQTTDIVNTIKDGSCFFIYYPEKKYLTRSKILNG
jgi:hypothetical protein